MKLRTEVLGLISVLNLLPLVSALEVQGQDSWSLASEPLFAVSDDRLPSRHIRAHILDSGRAVIAGRSGAPVLIGAGGMRPLLPPGEVRSVAGLWSIGERVGIVDSGRRELVLVDLETFSAVRHRIRPPVDAPSGRWGVYLGTYGNGDVALALVVGQPMSFDSSVADTLVLARFEPEGDLVRFLGRESGIRRRGGSPVRYSPFPMGAVLNDAVWYTDGSTAEVQVYKDGAGSPRAVRIEVEEGRPEAVPVFSAMIGTSKGLFLKFFDSETDSFTPGQLRSSSGGLWLVADEQGNEVARLRLPPQMELLDVSGVLALVAERPREKPDRVSLYEIVSGGG